MTSQTVHDPVCHMDIDPRTAASTSEYEGTAYFFCSADCKSSFDADPAGVLRAEAAAGHSRAMGGGAAAAKRPWWRFWG